jgi:hypothetical protein
MSAIDFSRLTVPATASQEQISDLIDCLGELGYQVVPGPDFRVDASDVFMPFKGVETDDVALLAYALSTVLSGLGIGLPETAADEYEAAADVDGLVQYVRAMFDNPSQEETMEEVIEVQDPTPSVKVVGSTKENLLPPIVWENRPIAEMNDIICRSMGTNWDKPLPSWVRLATAFTHIGRTILPTEWLEGGRIDRSHNYVRTDGRSILKAMYKLGVPLVGTSTKVKFSEGQPIETVEPCRFNVTFTTRDNTYFVIPEIESVVDEMPPLFDAERMSHGMVNYVHEVVSALDDETLLQFWAKFIPNSSLNGRELTFSPSGVSQYTNVIVRLPEAEDELISVSTGRTRYVNPVMDVSGIVVSGRTILTMMLMSLVNEAEYLITQSRVDGYLNLLSNMWVPAENYGAFKKSGEAIHKIYNNRELPVGMYCTLGIRYPFIHLVNVSAAANNGITSSRHMVEEFIKKGIAALPHKYGTFGKAVVFGAGVNAMGMAIARNEYGNYVVNNLETDEAWQRMIMRTVLDASKPSKFFNRPWTFFGSVFADGTEDFPLEKSKLHMMTYHPVDKEGTEFINEAVYVRGVRRKICYTNSLLTHGSGVASVNPSRQAIRYSVGKSEADMINDYSIPPTFRKVFEKDAETRNGAGMNSDWLQIVAEKLQEKADRIVDEAKATGKVFHDGDVVMTLFADLPDYKRDLVVVTAPNQDIYLERAEVVRVATTNAVRVRFFTRFEGEDYILKLRGPGVKFTTQLDDITFLSGFSDWDLFLNMECTKGELAQLYMYAEAVGECIYYPDTGLLEHVATGKVEDLKDVGAPFYKWVADNTAKEVIERKVSKEYLEYIAECHPGLVAFTEDDVTNKSDIVVKADLGHDYLVHETIQCLVGDMLFMVEISTPRENTSPAGLTLEQLALLEGVYADLALAFIHLSKEFHSGIQGMAKLILGKLPSQDQVPYLNLIEAGDVVNRVSRTDKGILMGRRLMQALKKEFPKGFVLFSTDSFGVYYDFDSMSRFMAFSGESGASGAAADISQLFHQLGMPADKRSARYWPASIHALNVSAQNLITAWVTQMGGEEGKGSKVLSRLGRTAKIGSNLKVKTVHVMGGVSEGKFITRPAYMQGLPVMGLNPNCASVKRLGIKAGDVVMAGRTPMGFPVFCYADVHPCYAIAHGYLLANVWAWCNEGDGDGDPMAIFNVTGIITEDNQWRYNRKIELRELSIKAAESGDFTKAKSLSTQAESIKALPLPTYEKMAALNKGYLSLGGYAAIYGSPRKHPFAEFCSPADKWSKKLLNLDVDKMMPGHYPADEKAMKKATRKSLITDIPVMDYLNANDAVANHYRINVGIGYGVASALAFLLADRRRKAIIEASKKAIAEGHDVEIYNGGMQLYINSDEADNFIRLQLAKNEELVNLTRGTVLAWRMLYEGYGLAGVSDEATMAFRILDVAARSNDRRIAVVTVDGQPRVEYPNFKPEAGTVATQPVLKNGAAYLTSFIFEKSPELRHSMLGGVNELIRARSLTVAIRDMERGREPRTMRHTTFSDVVIAGASRRLGQGQFGVQEQTDFSDEGDNEAHSMFELLEGIRCANGGAYPVHSNVVKYYLSIGASIMYSMEMHAKTKRAEMNQGY